LQIAKKCAKLAKVFEINTDTSYRSAKKAQNLFRRKDALRRKSKVARYLHLAFRTKKSETILRSPKSPKAAQIPGQYKSHITPMGCAPLTRFMR